MSLEQAKLNYVLYCDILMLTNVLNLALEPWLPFLKMHTRSSRFFHLTHTQRENDPFDLDYVD